MRELLVILFVVLVVIGIRFYSRRRADAGIAAAREPRALRCVT